MRRKSTDAQDEAEPAHYSARSSRATFEVPHMSAGGVRKGRAPLRRAGKEDDEQEKEQWIGDHLRKAYDEVLKEPVPDRLDQLLRELEKKERSSK